jgi:hypothetical protein
VVGDLRRVQQRLGGDASAMQARAADLVLLDEDDGLAELRRTQRRRVPAAAAAEDDDVRNVFCHDVSPVRNSMSDRTVAAVGPLSVAP